MLNIFLPICSLLRWTGDEAQLGLRRLKVSSHDLNHAVVQSNMNAIYSYLQRYNVGLMQRNYLMRFLGYTLAHLVQRLSGVLTG